MRVLAVVHHTNAAAGVFGESILAGGHELVEWWPHEEQPPSQDGYGAAIFLGGDMNVDQEPEYPWLSDEKRLLRDLLDRDTPVLGVCLGAQLLAEAAGGVVRRSERPEIGWHEVELTPEGLADPLLGGMPPRFESFQYHHYEWLEPPEGVTLARSRQAGQAFRLGDRLAWGLTFHPEVTETDLGSWLDDLHKDAAAVASGLDPEVIRAHGTSRIGSSNDTGRAISVRFLELAGHERRARPGAL
jgi:GMP synthase (glutamine-hydrolysing)